jgi:hypothetical protein
MVGRYLIDWTVRRVVSMCVLTSASTNSNSPENTRLFREVQDADAFDHLARAQNSARVHASAVSPLDRGLYRACNA